MPEDRCVCCGAVIPEGRQVCPQCANGRHIMRGLPRRGGKYAFAIRRAISLGGTIAVTRKKTREDILKTAGALGLPCPKVVVVSPRQKRPDPSVSLLIIDFDPTKED